MSTRLKNSQKKLCKNKKVQFHTSPSGPFKNITISLKMLESKSFNKVGSVFPSYFGKLNCTTGSKIIKYSPNLFHKYVLNDLKPLPNLLKSSDTNPYSESIKRSSGTLTLRKMTLKHNNKAVLHQVLQLIKERSEDISELKEIYAKLQIDKKLINMLDFKEHSRIKIEKTSLTQLKGEKLHEKHSKKYYFLLLIGNV